MKEKSITQVDISVGQNMYGRISEIPNTPSHVLAEFVDNALQSFRDHKAELFALDSGYRLRIDITFEWTDGNDRATGVTIRDNAAGIDSAHYEAAFKLGVTPENDKGLNEFGMGMKTAALWLGEQWSVRTSALGEDLCRTLNFDLREVLSHELKRLVVIAEDEKIENHYTEIVIGSMTAKAPARRSLRKIKDEISSIYRNSLRSDEADIYVDGEKLAFEDADILIAPSVKTPDGPPIHWKKEINFKFGKYKATGFIGILKNIDYTKNGFVLLRRGRAVYGAEDDGRYYPKCLCGSKGNARYKRLFGELELEGFDVSFNKNDFQDKENLEALMEALKGEIHTKDFDLYNQAEDYRLDIRKNEVNEIVRAHNRATRKKKGEKVVIETRPATLQSWQAQLAASGQPVATVVEAEFDPLGSTHETYTIDGKDYILQVDMVENGKDLVWLDTSRKSDNVVICKINMNHVFFREFKKQDKAIVTILKTLALAKFTAKEDGNDSTGELFNAFNDYIKQAKI